jgi:Tol biopolymer transport system component
MRRAIGAAVIGLALAAATPALAAFPGRNGRIAFVANLEKGRQIRTSTLAGHRMRVAANVPHDFSGLDDATGWPQWSPDGRRIAFDRGSATVMRAGGRHKRLLSSRLWMPGWAPGGRTLIGAGDSAPFPKLMRVGIDGTGLRPIALPNALSSSTPRWSPDGRWIVYGESSSEAPGSWQSVIRPDGTGHRRLDLGLQSTWSPDGRRIAYSYGPDVFSIRPDGTGRRALVRGAEDTSVQGLAWSPDGRRIVLVRQCCGTHDYSTVTTIPARGGRERVRFRRFFYIGAIDWQPR